MRDLQFIAKECIKEVEAAGITLGNITAIKENKRLKNTWGQCAKTISHYDNNNKPVYDCEIRISSRLLRDTTPLIALKNTIIHELLHTVKGCKGHNSEWQYYANVINNKYNYGIKRCSSDEDKGFKPSEEDYKYILKCSKCGKIWGYNRMCKSVKYFSHYICTECNEKLIRIK